MLAGWSHLSGFWLGFGLSFCACLTLAAALVVWLMAWLLERAWETVPAPRSRWGRFARWALHQGLISVVIVGLLVGALGLWLATWL